MTDIDVPELVSFWVPGPPITQPEVPVPVSGAASDRGLRVQTSGATTSSREIGPGVLELTLAPANEEVSLTVVVPAADVVTWWTPGSTAPHAQVPPSWAPPADLSAFAGLPLGVLVRDGERARLAYAVDAGLRTVDVRAGLVEESAAFAIIVRLPRAGSEPIRVRLDMSGRAFSRAARAAGEWLQAAYPAPHVPAAEDAVLCTWYFAHLGVDDAAVLAQAELASEYGFGTVIVDDGWQTSGTHRGYATTGDWRLSPDKFPQPRAFVERLSALGLRTLWWVGTPFIGYDSDAINAGLGILTREPELETAILDPRDPAARAHVVRRIRELLQTTGASGLKLDFLERFSGAESSIRDEVMAAAAEMLEDIVGSAEEVIGHPPLIEFREPYVHPAAARWATMIRVGDCPMSAIQNRLGIIDIRLGVPGLPVHSDPIMWGADESDERVALHLINALFGVPQISVDLRSLSPGHAAVLKFWLSFWNRHRALLLHGGLSAEHPERHYPIVSTEHDGEHLVVRYGSDAVALPRGAWRTLHIVNADEQPLVVLSDSVGRVHITVRDSRGSVIGEREAEWALGAQIVDVPLGGVADVDRLS